MRRRNRNGERGKFDVVGITGVLIITGLIATLILVVVLGSLLIRGCGKAVTVAENEFGPEAALKKYEWFKDASAQLDKKQADIGVYEARLAALEKAYEGVPRGEWPRDEREQWSQNYAELAGVKASYNDLAAQYNSEMSKWNWRFANVGELPKGATKPLPREYKPYETR